MSIKKVIIPAAGLGTRFLPATKSIPKEMFPIIDKPALQYIVEEAHNSGIEEVGIIISEEKPSILNHFSQDETLEARLIKANKLQEAKMIREIGNLVKITFIEQKEPKGLGHAIMCAKDFINGEDFAIMLGDDLIVNRKGEPVLKQMLDAYEKEKSSILGVQVVSDDDVSKYGIINPKVIIDDKMILADSVIEKPTLEEAPSRYAVLGRYVLTNKIFNILEHQKPGKGGEIQLTDAISTLMKEEKANDFYREVQMNPGIYIVKAQTAGGKEQTAKIRLR